nr:hypothetical protein [Tanacetum cinerariifolium]
MAPKRAAPRQTTRLNPGATSDPNQAPSTTTTTITNAQLQAMIDQGVNAALAARDANRTGDDSHTSGTGVRRTERVTRECTYHDFMKCQTLYFKGTEGVVEVTQWFERMETVFRISNCLAENQEENLTEQSLLGIFLSKEIFEGGMVRIHNAFVHDQKVALLPIQTKVGVFTPLQNLF